MVPWSSPGDVLRWWRAEVVGLTQLEAASRLNVQPSALSNWERGKRTISLELDDVDRALEGGGILAGLLWSFGSKDGLEPGNVWTKVFPGESSPVWVWIRSKERRLALAAEWGVARVDTQLELGPNGLFVTVGVSVPDSPIVLYLSEPGWADFGRGELPVDIPDAPVISAAKIFEASSADGKFMQLFKSTLTTKLSSQSSDVLDLARKVPKTLVSFVSTGRKRAEPPKRWPPEPEGIDAVERQAFARLRRSRNLSLPETCVRLARFTETDVSRDTLRRFETDVGVPHDPLLPIALDFVLGAEGRLAVLELRSSSGTGSVTLPPFWRGPLWIEFEVDQPADIVLHRGYWHRELAVEDDLMASVHWFDPRFPLRISAEPSVKWRVGVGRRAGAEAIDQNWTPTTLDVAQQAISELERAVMQAVDSEDIEPSDEFDLR